MEEKYRTAYDSGGQTTVDMDRHGCFLRNNISSEEDELGEYTVEVECFVILIYSISWALPLGKSGAHCAAHAACPYSMYSGCYGGCTVYRAYLRPEFLIDQGMYSTVQYDMFITSLLYNTLCKNTAITALFAQTLVHRCKGT